jgi:SAM-dependent methyltransferase
MNTPSPDYHDYVFRDGRLVGEFEAMYRHSTTVPWHQDEQRGWVDVRLTLEVLRDLQPFGEVHDFGCGLGYYLSILQTEVAAAGARCVGYDIAESACVQARALFPTNTFRQLDLTRQDAVTPALIPEGPPNRLFVIRGTLWYVVPQLARVVENLANAVGPQDHLLVVQNFPPLDKPFIGKDVLPDHHALVRHFAARSALRRHGWYEDATRATNDNWFIGLFSPKRSSP